MAQADLLIADRCRMDIAEVAALDDETWARLLAVARWREEREIERIEAGLVRAIATIFRKR